MKTIALKAQDGFKQHAFFSRTSLLADLEQIPEWIPLHPVGEFVGNGEKIIYDDRSRETTRASWNDYGNDYPLDYEHTTLSAELGLLDKASLAGWVDKMEERDGFVYGRVKWTSKAANEVLNGESRYVSPVFFVEEESGRVHSYHSFALVTRAGIRNQRLIGLSSKKSKVNIPSDDYFGEVEKERLNGGQSMDESQKKLSALLVVLGATSETGIDEAKKLVALSAAILELAGEKDVDKAIAKLKAFKADSEALPGVESKLSELADSIEIEQKKALIEKALSERKLTPALREWAEALSITDLSAYLEKAPVIIADSGASEPEGEGKLISLSAAIDEVEGVTMEDKILAARKKYPHLRGEQ